MKKLGKTARRPKGGSLIVRKKPFRLDALLTHVDPGPPAETEEFVRLIYEQRQRDRQYPTP